MHDLRIVEKMFIKIIVLKMKHIIIIFTLCEFFTTVLIGIFSLESESPQVSRTPVF